MKKLHLLASAVGLMALSLTSCQRTQYTTFQKSTTPAVEHVAKAKAPQSEVVTPVEAAPVAEEVKAPSLVEAAKPVESPKAEAPVAVASTKKGIVANRKAAELMKKIAFKKDEKGHVNVVAQSGKKLTAVEKLVVKKVNKQIVKAEKAQAKGMKPFADWNKYLRIGVIILAGALILSIISAVAIWSSGLWVLITLAWVAGWILTIYGLGLELAWW